MATALRDLWTRFLGRLANVFLRPSVVSDPRNFSYWEEHGYHVTPAHFYQPVPDTRALGAGYPGRSSAAGVDLRVERQEGLLRDLSARFGAEWAAVPRRAPSPLSFGLDNDAFTGIDPLVYHGMIRHLRPKRLIEAGSGHSTLLAFDTIRAHGLDTHLSVIDPEPRWFVRDLARRNASRIDLRTQAVETMDPGFFLALRENDVLFIDTSHVVRTGGDVVFLLLEVVPRLAAGVVVHLHDIYLPYEYPREVVLGDRHFFTEQYLLQAYLAGNAGVEVLFASHLMCRERAELVRAVFPTASLWGGSFWFRKG